MKSFIRVAVVASAVIGLAAISQPANAVAVDCPGGGQQHNFILDTTPGSSCLAFGSGNIEGDDDDVAGWLFVDKDGGNNQVDNGFSYTGHGTTSGSFSLTPEDGFKYAFGIKVGNNLDVSWAIFELAMGVTGGTWSVTPAQGGSISHGNLYRMATGDTNIIPLPASLPLLLAGLGGLGFIGWRRKGV